MPDLLPALQGLRDLCDALVIGTASGLAFVPRQRLGDPTDPRVLRADARLVALGELIGPLHATGFPSFVLRAREDFDQKLETVLTGAATSTDIEALQQAAETLYSVSLRGYGINESRTVNDRHYILDGLTKVLDAATAQRSRNNRSPTDDEVAEIVNWLFPGQIPG